MPTSPRTLVVTGGYTTVIGRLLKAGADIKQEPGHRSLLAATSGGMRR